MPEVVADGKDLQGSHGSGPHSREGDEGADVLVLPGLIDLALENGRISTSGESNHEFLGKN